MGFFFKKIIIISLVLRYIKKRGLPAKLGHKYVLYFLFVMQDKYYDAQNIQ